ncbi:NHL repeat-containing protein [Tenggerimyces flavus]|uniref:Uncharacterized protein n=1 Tax=Tenggerimyces flavus TaxID=1708749 RepID=A0ABV7YC32_9ACTN|nr:hypothetical protein [Tenggerimyces flavus]MBM7785651.1 hypothetical protein [Tenggerimyces flavus]
MRWLVPLALLAVLAGCANGATKQPNPSPVAATTTAPPSGPAAIFGWQDPDVAESSGLAAGPNGLLWTVNDAGNQPVVYGVNDKGETVDRIRAGTEQTDWEDVAVANGHIYVADTGDAYSENKQSGAGLRREIAVLRLALPSQPAAAEATELVTWRARFPSPYVPNVESILVEPKTEQVYLVTKIEQPGKPAEVWTFPSKPSTTNVNQLRRVATLNKTKLSGGAWSPDGRLLALRDATTAYVWKAGASPDLAEVFTHPPTDIPLPPQRQGEGMTFSEDGHALLVSSEGRGSEVWRVPLPQPE